MTAVQRVPIHGTRTPIILGPQCTWGKPKLNPWKMESAVTFKDTGYMYTTITAVPYKDNLFIRLRRYDGKLKYLTLHDFRSYTAREVLVAYDFGRHFTDAIHTVYHNEHLRLGYTIQMLRSLN